MGRGVSGWIGSENIHLVEIIITSPFKSLYCTYEMFLISVYTYLLGELLCPLHVGFECLLY